MKKKFIIILSTLLVTFSIFALFLYQRPTVKKDRSFEVNSTVIFEDLFTKSTGLLDGKQVINTATVGTYSTVYKFKNLFGIEQEKEVNYTIVDTIAPIIEVEENTSILITNKTIDELFSVTDNSNSQIQVEILNPYDLMVVGNYNVLIVATDLSGNSSQKEININVYDTETIDGSVRHYFFTSKGFFGYTQDDITYIEDCLIANKTYSLPASYNASNNHSAKDMNGLDETTRKQFQLLIDAAQKEGYTIKLGSGFRGYDYQKALYNKRVKEKGFDYAEVYVARAGYSEHQTGLAFDVNSCNNNFTKTKEYQWMLNNCYKYGFIIRYPEGKSNETGYSFESWHYRYVGKELAEKIYNNGNWLSLEDYFGITSVYQ